jgi:hypothetical protein
MPSAPAQLAFIGLDTVQPTLTTDRAEDYPVPSTITSGPEPDLAAYDLIVAGLSGKDAHAMLDRLTDQARRAGVFDRLFTVHADMGLTSGRRSTLAAGTIRATASWSPRPRCTTASRPSGTSRPAASSPIPMAPDAPRACSNRSRCGASFRTQQGDGVRVTQKWARSGLR